MINTNAEKVIELQDELIDVLRERNSLQARLADRDLDAECYHHLCGLIRANPNAAAGEVLDWFKGDAAREGTP